MTKDQLLALMKPENFTGCAESQTERFLAECVKPVLDANRDALGMHGEVNV